MMSIAGYNVSDYIQGLELSTSSYTTTWPLPVGPKASNTTLYELLFYPFNSGYNSSLTSIGFTSNINITTPQHFQLAYASSDLWVLVYWINYTGVV
jgi:hypothetical protein